jgi:hypothetical protein
MQGVVTQYDPAHEQLSGCPTHGFGAQLYWMDPSPRGAVCTHTASALHPAGVPGQGMHTGLQLLVVTCQAPFAHVAVPPQQSAEAGHMRPSTEHGSPWFGFSAGHTVVAPPAPELDVAALAPAAVLEVVALDVVALDVVALEVVVAPPVAPPVDTPRSPSCERLPQAMTATIARPSPARARRQVPIRRS